MEDIVDTISSFVEKPVFNHENISPLNKLKDLYNSVSYRLGPFHSLYITYINSCLLYIIKYKLEIKTSKINSKPDNIVSIK
jgi:hypothetical protein